MQTLSLVQEPITINPRDYFVKRPRDAKKVSQPAHVRTRGEFVNLLVKAKFSFNTL
jgi:hypothetical protein